MLQGAKKLIRMAGAIVGGRAVMFMQAEGEAPVAYDLGTETEADCIMSAKDMRTMEHLCEEMLLGGLEVDELGFTYDRKPKA